MRIAQNMNACDRIARVIVGGLLGVFAFAWTSGWLQMIGFVLGSVLVVTALIGFCPLYLPMKISTSRFSCARKWVVALIALGVILLPFAYWVSDVVTAKQFIERYQVMNAAYKQALFQTGQASATESPARVEAYARAYDQFFGTYETYRPPKLRGDAAMTSDLQHVRDQIPTIQELVRNGQYTQAHTALEGARPVFQDLLKRNGFSFFTMALVDFHDAMEVVLDHANTRDAQGVIDAYGEADTRLRAVEAQKNDAGVQAIRTKLQQVVDDAKRGTTDALARDGAALKSAFVSVYLLEN